MMRGKVVPAFLDPGMWSACFGLSWTDLLLHDATHTQRVMFPEGTFLRKTCGAAGIADARNEAVESFLAGTNAEWLWFIDTDMGFASDTVDRLVASANRYDRPVVGGLCFALRRTEAGLFGADRYGIVPTVYSYHELENECGFAPIRDYPKDEVTRVSGTGAACLLIHRRVLENVAGKFGPRWFDMVEHPAGLKGKRRTFSEDLSFMVRLASLGIDVHVDTSVKTVHHKGGVFLDEDMYLAQQAVSG